MKISVIFTTYNSPIWLQKVLWGFACQTDKNFEIVIADDGSKSDTKDVINNFKLESNIDIQHIWHEDKGFQKCLILNKSIVAAQGEYLVFTDGDCIPRKDFVSTHRYFSEKNYFLSGGYFKLPMNTSHTINKASIQNGSAFKKDWLLVNGMRKNLKFMKLTAGPVQAKLYNTLTLTKPSWNGHNASCYKSDALRINGFDERMRYGGQDREFGERLINAGLKPKQIRYSAICIHLDHARGYANQEDWQRNRDIRHTTRVKKIIETPSGIRQQKI